MVSFLCVLYYSLVDARVTLLLAVKKWTMFEGSQVV